MKATKQIEEGGACDTWKQKIKKKKKIVESGIGVKEYWPKSHVYVICYLVEQVLQARAHFVDQVKKYP